MSNTAEKSRVNDTDAFLTNDMLVKTRIFIADYYGFINLILFFVLIWPVAMFCFSVDRVFRTRLLDSVIRFCEAF